MKHFCVNLGSSTYQEVEMTIQNVSSLAWGWFPPEWRYNIDQVSLPFVNGQDVTLTTDDDKDVNIKCPKEVLQKRQFTMYLFFNTGTGNLAEGWCDLVCKGTGKRISQAEKDLGLLT